MVQAVYLMRNRGLTEMSKGIAMDTNKIKSNIWFTNVLNLRKHKENTNQGKQ